MRLRHVVGRALGVAYVVLLVGLVSLLAGWSAGPGWGLVTFGLLGFAAVALAGTLAPRRFGFVGLPLLFFGGLPAQVVAFVLAIVGPGVLHQPFRDPVASRLTGALFALVATWFLGFFLLVATPAPRAQREETDREAEAMTLTPIRVDE